MSKFGISGSPLQAVFNSCRGVPILHEWWLTRVPLKFATRMSRPLLSPYPAFEAVPCPESTLPLPSSWSHSRGETPFHTICPNMYLVQHKGSPGFCLPGCYTWRERQVALDFDPSSRVLALKLCCDIWLSSLSLWSRRPLSPLVTF